MIISNFFRARYFSGAMACLALCQAPVRAITADQAKTAIQSFNNTYWQASNKTFYKFDNKTGTLDYWMWAHAWETEMDAYERTKDPADLQKIRDVYDGFVTLRGRKMSNVYNDDQGWWVMAATRAYELTRVVEYRDFAKLNFDWMYTNQADATLGGGIWWKNTDKNQKNAASTLPFSVAGFKLAKALGDASYGDKALKLHAWVKSRLWRPTGEVGDRVEKDNTVVWGPLSYNHGTFISSSWEAFKLTGDSTYFRDALTTTTYFKTVKCDAKTGIFPDERGDGTGNTDNDAGMYKTVFVHWAMRFIIEAKQWQYLPWLNDNANSLWNNRRKTDNLMYFAWSTPAPTGAGTIGAQMATGGVALLNLMVVAESIQSQYYEGMDTTNVQGQGLANAFTVTANGISANGGKMAFYHFNQAIAPEVSHLYSESFQDIKKAPADFSTAENYQGTDFLNAAFVLKMADSTYAKVSVLKKLPDGRYLYRYGISKVRNNTVLIESDYARGVRYKPNNFQIQSAAPSQGAAGVSTSIFTWESPIANDNALTGYEIYAINVSKADTGKAINLADWTLLASTTQAAFTWNRVGDDQDKYVNIVAVYANGKSAPLDGWVALANPNRTPTEVGPIPAHGFWFQTKAGAVSYLLPREGRLTMALYDYSGQLLEAPYSGVQKAGRYTRPLPDAAAHSRILLLKIGFEDQSVIEKIFPNH